MNLYLFSFNGKLLKYKVIKQTKRYFYLETPSWIIIPKINKNKVDIKTGDWFSSIEIAKLLISQRFKQGLEYCESVQKILTGKKI